jgi:hypothetical protein
MKSAGITAGVLALALAIGGCGSGSSGTSSTGTTSASSGPPRASETIKQAADRVAAAVKSGDCDQINPLLVGEYADEGGLGKSSCDYVKQIGAFKGPLASKEYGTGGAIDYYDPDGTYDPAVVMVVGDDSKWHIAYIDTPGGVVESTKSLLGSAKKDFDRSAEQAVDALRTGNCKEFLGVAYRSFGIGGGSDADVCKRLPSSPVATALKDDPQAKPVPLGGNSNNAFYGLSTSDGYFTIVEAQQPPSVNLPADAAQYAFVNGYKGS